MSILRDVEKEFNSVGRFAADPIIIAAVIRAQWEDRRTRALETLADAVEAIAVNGVAFGFDKDVEG